MKLSIFSPFVCYILCSSFSFNVWLFEHLAKRQYSGRIERKRRKKSNKKKVALSAVISAYTTIALVYLFIILCFFFLFALISLRNLFFLFLSSTSKSSSLTREMETWLNSSLSDRQEFIPMLFFCVIFEIHSNSIYYYDSVCPSSIKQLNDAMPLQSYA